MLDYVASSKNHDVRADYYAAVILDGLCNAGSIPSVFDLRAEDTGSGRTLVTWTPPRPVPQRGYQLLVYTQEAELFYSRTTMEISTGAILPPGVFTIYVLTLSKHYHGWESTMVSILGKGARSGTFYSSARIYCLQVLFHQISLSDL